MNLLNVTAVIRPRTEWESVDLGYCMVRQWARPIYTAWVVVSLPLVMLPWILLHGYAGWALLIFWWSRVLAELLVLDFLSKALFGAAPSPGAIARNWPRLVLAHGPRLLLLRPFSLARTFLLPIVQLEGLRGAERRERIRVVAARGREHAWLVAFCSFGFECIFLLGLLLTAMIFIPEELRPAVETTFSGWATPDASLLVHGLVGLLLWAAWSMVAPFHVGAGFSGYLNRRALLEGWDIEIAFRRMAQRLLANRTRLRLERRKSRPADSATLLLLVSCLAWPAPGEAQKSVSPKEKEIAGSAISNPSDVPENRPADPWIGEGEDPNDQISLILEREEFGHEETRTEFQFRPFGQGKRKSDRQSNFTLGGLPVGFLAPVLEVLLWTIAIALVIGLVVLALRAWGERQSAGSNKGTAEIPLEVFGLDIRRESLPDDPAAEALALLAKGEARKALSLLYRATLVRLVQHDGLPIEDSWTEGDCLRWLDGATSNRRFDSFAELTALWSQSAYAHRDPDATRLRALCQNWSQLWAAPQAAPGSTGVAS